jgi:hypothetical protein
MNLHNKTAEFVAEESCATLPPCLLWKANCDYISPPLKVTTKGKDFIQSKHNRTYRGDLGFFGFISPG